MNLNKGCIEIKLSLTHIAATKMNLNKGCIEILKLLHPLVMLIMMNLNKGCIEIVAALF